MGYRGLEGFRWTTVCRDTTRAEDEKFTHTLCDSATTASLREEIAALRLFAQRPELAGSIQRPLRVYIYTSLKQFEILEKRGWFMNAIRQVRISESITSPILRICLTLLLSFFIIAVTVLPDVIGFTINERAFNARTLPAQSRTGIQILSMILFPQASLRLAWTFAVERLALPIANTVGYSFVAWNPKYSHLPEQLWFQVTVGIANVLGQLGQAFIMNIWLKWEELWRRRVPPLPIELQYQAGIRYASLKKKIDVFHALAKQADLGRHMNTQVALTKGDLQKLEDILLECSPPSLREIRSRPRYPRSPRLFLFFLTLGIIVLNAVAYYYDYYLVLTVAAAGVFVLLRQGERALSPYHSTRDMINGFSILTAGQVPAIIVLAIPLLVARERYNTDLLANTVVFAVLTTILGILTNTVTDLFADFMLVCARKVNWIADEDTVKSQREHEDIVDAAISTALESFHLSMIEGKELGASSSVKAVV
ncbi:hypothetical protein F5B22DRAFT_636738 [Xylaria bambusicola]|uniref:uncharacterized protein n=1 Tax=Xylaria bambusicola TaxID=326684 RepID=UPI002008C13B|nr:uncharacterized protein F5B22DRAFT_636738 [Xylaria bambusicola]KAI0514885.1 hypothetical protein F5B22DRAFT_636738 [Xylaria bambusicola]